MSYKSQKRILRESRICYSNSALNSGPRRHGAASCRTHGRLALLAALAFLNSAALAVNTNLTFKADLTLKETYDDNVFILDTEPNPAVTPPAGYTISEAKKVSLVTSVTPSLTLNYKPCAAFAATVSYAPEFTWYHSAHSEDYVAHRGAINFSGKIDDVTYDWLNSVTWIDGSHLGPVTMRPGDWNVC